MNCMAIFNAVTPAGNHQRHTDRKNIHGRESDDHEYGHEQDDASGM
jgi:hypothetical protein